MEKENKLLKYRKIIFICLFLVVLPLVLLGIVGISYRVQHSKFEAKIGSESKTYSKRLFKNYVQGTSGTYEFDTLKIEPTSRIVFYESEQDKKDRFDPIGYGVNIKVSVDVKEGTQLDGQRFRTLVYACLDQKPSTDAIKFEEKTFYKDTTSAKTYFLKTKNQLPYHVPFVGKVKNCYVHMIIKVPYLKQDVAEALMAKNSSLTETSDKVKKVLRYKEFYYRISVDSLIKTKDFSHRVW